MLLTQVAEYFTKRPGCPRRAVVLAIRSFAQKSLYLGPERVSLQLTVPAQVPIRLSDQSASERQILPWLVVCLAELPSLIALVLGSWLHLELQR